MPELERDGVANEERFDSVSIGRIHCGPCLINANAKLAGDVFDKATAFGDPCH